MAPDTHFSNGFLTFLLKKWYEPHLTAHKCFAYPRLAPLAAPDTHFSNGFSNFFNECSCRGLGWSWGGLGAPDTHFSNEKSTFFLFHWFPLKKCVLALSSGCPGEGAILIIALRASTWVWLPALRPLVDDTAPGTVPGTVPRTAPGTVPGTVPLYQHVLKHFRTCWSVKQNNNQAHHQSNQSSSKERKRKNPKKKPYIKNLATPDRPPPAAVMLL